MTLIELLTAIALLSSVILIIGQWMTSISRLSDEIHTSTQHERTRQAFVARLHEDLLIGDFRAAERVEIAGEDSVAIRTRVEGRPSWKTYKFDSRGGFIVRSVEGSQPVPILAGVTDASFGLDQDGSLLMVQVRFGDGHTIYERIPTR